MFSFDYIFDLNSNTIRLLFRFVLSHLYHFAVSSSTAPVDPTSDASLALQEERVQCELSELILQVQSKNQSLLVETLHRFQTARHSDATRIRELESENAALRAHVDRLLQEAHSPPAAAAASVPAAVPSGVDARVAGLKAQLAHHERLLLDRQADLKNRDQAAAQLTARVAQLELELRECAEARSVAELAVARERAGVAAIQAAAEHAVQLANAAAERARADALATKEREVRDLEDATRRRIDAIQLQSDARWREAEAECERLRESLRQAERQALQEQQAMLALDAGVASGAYDNNTGTPSSASPENHSPDWRAKGGDRANNFAVPSDASVEDRWNRVYDTLRKLSKELQ